MTRDRANAILAAHLQYSASMVMLRHNRSTTDVFVHGGIFRYISVSARPSSGGEELTSEQRLEVLEALEAIRTDPEMNPIDLPVKYGEGLEQQQEAST